MKSIEPGIPKRIFVNSLLVVLPLLVIEGIFRFLPVSNLPYLLPVTAQNPIAHFEPNVDYLFSMGPGFAIRSTSHTNNFGHTNIADYHPADSTPLLAVIGDSFVEAHHVDAGKSAGEILNARLHGKGRVYTFGISGAALSQYLAFADYARTTFRPNAMAFVIIENDFDESLLKYKSEPRLHYFEERGDHLVLRRLDYELSTTKKILRQSALVRYVVLNLRAGETLKGLRRILSRSGRVRSSRGSLKIEERIQDSKRAIDFFLDQVPLKSGLRSDSVAFVLDGVRPGLYSPEAWAEVEHGYAAQMMRYFKEQAVARGYEVLDMQPVFMAKHHLDNSRFEFATDGHWNELGHRVVAEALRGSAVFRRTFPR